MVLCHVNARETEGRKTANSYAVFGYPTIVLVDEEGRTIDRWLGYARDRFLHTMDEALADLTPVDQKRSRFEQTPNRIDAAALGRIHESRRESQEALEHFQRAQEVREIGSPDYAHAIFSNLWEMRGLDSFDIVKSAADKALAGADPIPLESVRVCEKMARWCRLTDRDSLMAHYLRTGIRVAEKSDDGGPGKRFKTLQSDMALYVDQDTARAVVLIKDYLPKDWKDDARFVMFFCHWCYTKNVNLDEADSLAERAVSLAKPGQERARILYQLATMPLSGGQHREALSLLERSDAEDPGNSSVRTLMRNIRTIVAHEDSVGE